MYSEVTIMKYTKDFSAKIDLLKKAINEADTIVIGAGAGLSTSAGFTYSGERFKKSFSDFSKKFGITDMYSGGFYPFPDDETFWAWWSRHIYYNRYVDIPKPVYSELLRLVRDKDYFVITTNVDHCFQKAGFDKERLFYTQGDYGLFQCSEPCHQKTYDNEETVRAMLEQQKDMRIPTELIPHCPVCGKPMTVNLRSDDSFVEDEGWHRAAKRYADFIDTHKGKILYLELGVGFNTPSIIKYPFWRMTKNNPNATYACINFGDAGCPAEIRTQSICIDGDIGNVLKEMI